MPSDLWTVYQALPDTKYPLLTVGCNGCRLVYSILPAGRMIRYEDLVQTRRLDLFTRTR